MYHDSCLQSQSIEELINKFPWSVICAFFNQPLQTWGKHFVKCLKHKFKHFQKGLKHKYKHMCFIKKVLEAQFQALAKGLKHKHKHFLTEYIFPSFRYRNRMSVKSVIKFYCKYLLLHLMNISLKNVVSASWHLSGLRGLLVPAIITFV